jgi:hypothetical protein
MNANEFLLRHLSSRKFSKKYAERFPALLPKGATAVRWEGKSFSRRMKMELDEF